MRIHVGIIGDAAGWNVLLSQEGVPYSRVHGDLTPEHFSAVVVHDMADDREIEMLRQYLRLGGGAICSAKVYAEIRESTSGHRQVEYLLPEEDSLFADAGLVDVHRRLPVAWSANEIPSDKAGDTAFVGQFDAGQVVVFPFDASDLVVDERAERKSFFSPFDRLPFERVSLVSKNGIRRIVARALRHLHAVRGLPYVHAWYYPERLSSVFALRIDTDFGSPSQVEALYEFLRAKRVHASWFVDVESQQSFLWRYAEMGGQEIGLHGHEHRTWDDGRRNHENILKARDAFRSLNFGSFGFAAPFGMWNQELGRVLQEFRFEYSSEFAYDYDNFPSFPPLGGALSRVLQMPVHPISIGSLRRQGYTPEMMKAYFHRVIQEKRSRSEPLFFYHHPKDGNLEVLESIIDECLATDVKGMTFRDYASWWKERRSEDLNFDLKENTLRTESKFASINSLVRIVHPDGRVALTEAQPRVDLTTLSWAPTPEPTATPSTIERIRSFNYRIPLTVAVDMLSRFRSRI